MRRDTDPWHMGASGWSLSTPWGASTTKGDHDARDQKPTCRCPGSVQLQPLAAIFGDERRLVLK